MMKEGSKRGSPVQQTEVSSSTPGSPSTVSASETTELDDAMMLQRVARVYPEDVDSSQSLASSVRPKRRLNDNSLSGSTEDIYDTPVAKSDLSSSSSSSRSSSSSYSPNRDQQTTKRRRGSAASGGARASSSSSSSSRGNAVSSSSSRGNAPCAAEANVVDPNELAAMVDTRKKRPQLTRWYWPQDLHDHFVIAYHALEDAGKNPSPRKVMSLMKINNADMDDLSIRQVQSHHQKYRLRVTTQGKPDAETLAAIAARLLAPPAPPVPAVPIMPSSSSSSSMGRAAMGYYNQQYDPMSSSLGISSSLPYGMNPMQGALIQQQQHHQQLAQQQLNIQLLRQQQEQQTTFPLDLPQQRLLSELKRQQRVDSEQQLALLQYQRKLLQMMQQQQQQQQQDPAVQLSAWLAQAQNVEQSQQQQLQQRQFAVPQNDPASTMAVLHQQMLHLQQMDQNPQFAAQWQQLIQLQQQQQAQQQQQSLYLLQQQQQQLASGYDTPSLMSLSSSSSRSNLGGLATISEMMTPAPAVSMGIQHATSSSAQSYGNLYGLASDATTMSSSRGQQGSAYPSTFRETATLPADLEQHHRQLVQHQQLQMQLQQQSLYGTQVATQQHQQQQQQQQQQLDAQQAEAQQRQKTQSSRLASEAPKRSHSAPMLGQQQSNLPFPANRRSSSSLSSFSSSSSSMSSSMSSSSSSSYQSSSAGRGTYTGGAGGAAGNQSTPAGSRSQSPAFTPQSRSQSPSDYTTGGGSGGRGGPLHQSMSISPSPSSNMSSLAPSPISEFNGSSSIFQSIARPDASSMSGMGSSHQLFVPLPINGAQPSSSSSRQQSSSSLQPKRMAPSSSSVPASSGMGMYMQWRRGSDSSTGSNQRSPLMSPDGSRLDLDDMVEGDDEDELKTMTAEVASVMPMTSLMFYGQ